jgi:hypothetical protein
MGISENKKRTAYVLLVSLAAIFICYIIMYMFRGSNILYHEYLDSYTKQALAWRNGHIKLDQNYEYLELAVYKGNYYVSFPPVPAIPMFLLTFFYGENTPNNLMTVLYTLGSFAFIFAACKKKKMTDSSAVFWAAFTCFASGLLFISLSGAVWFQAQALSFLFTSASVYFILDDKPKSWHVSLLFLALAVGCRPFQIIYFPILYFIIFKKLKWDLKKLIKFLIVPAVVGAVYLGYNYIRFGELLEFGHNYLPEFQNAKDGQFSLHYMKDNLQNLFFRIPRFDDGMLRDKYGFAFYMSSPIFITALIKAGTEPFLKTREKESYTVEKVILALLICLHICIFSMHKTLGGWQFGSRYTVDIIPMVFLFLLFTGIDKGKKRFYDYLFFGGAVIFNLLGSISTYLFEFR